MDVISAELTEKLVSVIQYVVKSIFQNLNTTDTDYLITSVCEVVYVIGYKFHFIPSNLQTYMTQLTQNDSRDIKAIVNMLLPYIDDDQEGSKKRMLSSFRDLYTKKNDQKKYDYVNIQYNRCLRKNFFMDKELEYSPEHFEHNKRLLFDTIQLMCNKLYVNWLDIIPYTLENYTSSIVYKNTWDMYGRISIQEWYLDIKDTNAIKYTGISLPEIYQTIGVHLYDDIKNDRWLIYDVVINTVPVNMIFILNSLLPLTSICEKVTWSQLNPYNKHAFTEKWNTLMSSFKSQTPINDIPSRVISKLMTAILIFFQKYYVSIDDLKDFVPIAHTKQYDKVLVYNTLNTVHVSHIYEYMYKSILTVSQTWFGLYLFTKKYNESKRKLYNYIIPHEYAKHTDIDIKSSLDRSYTTVKSNFSKYGVLFHENGKYVTIKNLYNYAKSLRMINGQIQPKYWSSLSMIIDKTTGQQLEVKKEMTDRINSDIRWTGFKGYVSRIYGITDRKQLDDYDDWLYREVVSIMPDAIVQCKIINGCFSEFVPSNKLTDRSLVSEPYEKHVAPLLKQYIFSKHDYKQSYYYLTNEQYGQLEDVVTADGSSSWFDTLMNNMTWYTNYAMDWLSQINFFHKFINNRIMYVTGATGQGKSTQVPKLLLYGLKSIYYKQNGKVICTIPRKNATRSTAMRVSHEMGVPIEQYNSVSNILVRSVNYNVQFRYQGDDSHQPFSDTRVDSFIRFSTDGLLLQQLLTNPLLKVKRKDKYTLRNIFDVVMVDESHEHNVNMDVILTLMRNVIANNNSIKLIIVSATMDDDEPIYRRYYRDINDNRMFPWNYAIEYQQLDRINVDRRVHIAPPGKGTKYNITEHWLPPKPNENIYENIVKLAVNICRENRYGDILIFVTGMSEIRKLLQMLNESPMIDRSTIAIPYYGEMDEHEQQKVMNISKTITEFHYKKDDVVFSLMYPTQFKNEKIPEDSTYTYNRAIIIATPVAEASITINSLKFVIDTGYHKKAYYDTKSKSMTLKTFRIAEMNRVQRRGRVGRVSDGTVYYLYSNTDTAKADSSIKYEITQNNMSLQLFDLLSNPKFTEDATNSIDFNLVHSNHIYLSDALKGYPDDVVDVFRYHYCKQDFDNIIPLLGVPSQYDYENSISYTHIHDSYVSGSMNEVQDQYGRFYLIHPDENNLTRDILGNIINQKLAVGKYRVYGDHVSYMIQSPKIQNAIQQLFDLLFLVSYEDTKDIDSSLTSKNLSVTKYGTEVYKLYKSIVSKNSILQISFTINHFLCYLWARHYGIDNVVLKVLFAVMRTRGSIFNLSNVQYVKRKTKYDYAGFSSRFVSKTSDFDVLIRVNELVSKLKTFLETPIHEYDTKNVFDEKDEHELETMISNWYTVNNSYELTNVISSKAFNFLKRREFNGHSIQHDSQTLEAWNLENKVSHNDIIIEKNLQIYDVWHNIVEKWCMKYNLNPGYVYDYLVMLPNVERTIDSINTFEQRKLLGLVYSDEQAVSFDWFDQNTRIGDISDNSQINLIKCMLRGFGNQVMKSSMNLLNKGMLLSIKTIFGKSDYDTRLVSLGEYVLYLNIMTKETVMEEEANLGETVNKTIGLYNVSMLANVKPEWILETNPHIYTREMLKEIGISKLSNSNALINLHRFAISDDVHLSKYIAKLLR